jgi:glucose/arabinose dehydrogenase
MRPHTSIRLGLLFPALLSLGAPGSARAQGCVMPPNADFKYVTVAGGMSNPTHMAILPNGEVFITTHGGTVHHHVPGQPLRNLGRVPGAANVGEDGTLGIVADLDFAQTRWLYILHSVNNPWRIQLSRFTLANGGLTNQKKLLDFPRIVKANFDHRHAGGGMAWNRRTGDLHIVTGDDTHPFTDRSIYGPRDPDNEAINALRTSANTNDLRGKSLRIRTIPFPDSENPAMGVGTTYAIPPGNLFPPGQFPADKTRPEIYTMGLRNAYRVKVDTLTGWAFIGEVGADASDPHPGKGPPGYDHLYLVDRAANFGWPFANGNLEPYRVRDYESLYLAAGYKVGDLFNLAKLQNLSAFNTGLVDLPPAQPPLIYYCALGLQGGLLKQLGGGAETIMAGPGYDYRPGLASTVKLPPFFHRKVFFADHSRRYLWLMTLDAAGKLTALNRLPGSYQFIDMDIGPDGSLYVLDYDGSLYSLQYAGGQQDYRACAFIKEGCLDPRFAEYDRAANLHMPSLCKVPVSTVRSRLPEGLEPIRLLAGGVGGRRIPVRVPPGKSVLEAFDLGGRKLHMERVEGGTVVDLPESTSGEGMILLRFQGDRE